MRTKMRVRDRRAHRYLKGKGLVHPPMEKEYGLHSDWSKHHYFEYVYRILRGSSLRIEGCHDSYRNGPIKDGPYRQIEDKTNGESVNPRFRKK